MSSYDEIEKVTNIIRTSIGPAGGHVLINRTFSKPYTASSALDILEFISNENVWGRIIYNTGLKTRLECGLGGSITALLLSTILLESIKMIQSGINPHEINEGLEKVKIYTIQYLKELRNMDNDIKNIYNIAKPAVYDEDIARIIEEAFQISDGNIFLEKGGIGKSRIYDYPGMSIELPYLHPYAAREEGRTVVRMKNVFCFVSESVLENPEEIIPIINYVSDKKGSLFIFAADISIRVQAELMKAQRNMKCHSSACVYRSVLMNAEEICEDIAAFTNGKCIRKQYTDNLQNINISHLGFADEIIQDSKMTLIKSVYNTELIYERCEYLKGCILNENDPAVRIRLEKRLKNINSNAATIIVCSENDLEMKQEEEKYRKALRAVHSMKKSGYLPGGGLSYLLAAEEIKKKFIKNNCIPGAKILEQALITVPYNIVRNAGLSGYNVIEEMKKSSEYIFDVLSNKMLKYKSAGIYDPYLSVINSITRACDTSKLLLTGQIYSCKNKCHSYPLH